MKWPARRHFAVTLPIVLAAFVLSWMVTRDKTPDQSLVIAGTIVDESNNPLGQTTITLANTGERCFSEDNGNYKLDLTGKSKTSDRVRIHFTKEGYSPYDASVEVPTRGFVVRLHRL